MASTRVQVIINPAAGQDRPILSTLNTVFRDAGVDWDVSITQEAGDGRRLAQDAVAAGVDIVAVYGGDGTVAEVANGLIESKTPLAILPGGTANVLAAELGIPGDLREACTLALGDNNTVQAVDVGRIGKRYFLLRAGIGLEAAMVEGADRQLKNHLGSLAYVLSALRALPESETSSYHLTLDGKEIVSEGITCIIANSGTLGVPDLTLSPTIKVDDGFLDVIVVRKADLNLLLSVAVSVIEKNDPDDPLQHWQARDITVVAHPPQTVQADGEVLGRTPISIRATPQAVKILVPKATN